MLKLIFLFLGLVAASNHTVSNGTNTTNFTSTTTAGSSPSTTTSSGGGGGGASTTTSTSGGGNNNGGGSSNATTTASATASYVVTATVTATIALPAGISVGDLTTSRRRELSALTGLNKTNAITELKDSLITAYAAAVSTTKSYVTIASIAAGRRRLEEKRGLAATATALVITYSVTFPAGADPAVVKAVGASSTGSGFGSSFASEFATAVAATSTLSAACGSDCVASGVTATVAYTKNGSTLSATALDADIAASTTAAPATSGTISCFAVPAAALVTIFASLM